MKGSVWHEATEVFLVHLAELKLDPPIREYKFLEHRDFKFDFAWPLEKLAAECDGGGPRSRGGIGRHQDVKTRQIDFDKHNAATIRGWRIFHFSPADLKTRIAARAVFAAFARYSGSTEEQFQRLWWDGLPEYFQAPRKARGSL